MGKPCQMSGFLRPKLGPPVGSTYNKDYAVILGYIRDTPIYPYMAGSLIKVRILQSVVRLLPPPLCGAPFLRLTEN